MGVPDWRRANLVSEESMVKGVDLVEDVMELRSVMSWESEAWSWQV